MVPSAHYRVVCIVGGVCKSRMCVLGASHEVGEQTMLKRVDVITPSSEDELTATRLSSLYAPLPHPTSASRNADHLTQALDHNDIPT